MQTSNASVIDVLDDVSILLLTGGSCRHDSFHKAAALFALGSKASLPPQHTMSHHAFCKIVGRLDAFHIYKCPKALCTLQNSLAGTRHLGVTADLPLDQEIFHVNTKLNHISLKRLSLQCPVTHPVPPVKHLLGLHHKLTANPAGFATKLAESREVADQMRLMPTSA